MTQSSVVRLGAGLMAAGLVLAGCTSTGGSMAGPTKPAMASTMAPPWTP